MSRETLSDFPVFIETNANLAAVITDTDGDSVDMRGYDKKSVFINVSVNTGAVTVTIEASHDETTWYEVMAKTYTATTGTDIYSYTSFFPYMRVTTTTQSSSTVTATITGRS